MAVKSGNSSPAAQPEDKDLRKKLRRLSIWLIILAIIILLLLAYLLLTQVSSKQSLVDTKTKEKEISALLDSVKSTYNWDDLELLERLQQLPKSIEELKRTFDPARQTYEIGMTNKTGVFLPLLSRVNEIPTDILNQLSETSRISKQQMQSEPGYALNYLRFGNTVLNPDGPELDLRKYVTIAPPRDQRNTNACWAFAASSIYETCYQLRFKDWINISPQHIINCSEVGTAQYGGQSIRVFDWLVKSKQYLTTETSMPYIAADITCTDHGSHTNFYTRRWGLVDPANNPIAIPSVRDIKTSLCRFGPISSSMTTNEYFGSYVRGVINDKSSTELTNHAILIIGWNDQKKAWLCKNSYGSTEWGDNCGFGRDRGYCWIAYNSMNIGKRAAWILPSNEPIP